MSDIVRTVDLEDYYPETVTDEEDAYAEFDYDDGDYAYEHAVFADQGRVLYDG